MKEYAVYVNMNDGVLAFVRGFKKNYATVEEAEKAGLRKTKRIWVLPL